MLERKGLGSPNFFKEEKEMKKERKNFNINPELDRFPFRDSALDSDQISGYHVWSSYFDIYLGEIGPEVCLISSSMLSMI